MKITINNVRFMSQGTMCFGDLYIQDGFVERIDYKTPKPYSDIAINGFVDIHTHGFRGISCETADIDALHQLAIQYAKRGTVAFLATLDPMPLKDYEIILQKYREAFKGDYLGARFCGIHLEGPFLNPKRANDIDITALQPIDLKELEHFLFHYSDLIKIMSISPELEHGLEAVAMLKRFGIKASIAHSECSYDQTKQAISAGISQVTHLCNAMADFDHHQAGILDAVIESDLLCELNMDGVHIQRPMLKWLTRLLGSHRVMAISDGSRYSGYDYPQDYQLDATHVVKNHAIYTNGHLANSFRDILDAFRFLHLKLEYPLSDCIAMTSTNAGKLINTLNYEIGLGKKADLLVMDHNLELKDVIINGKHSL